MHSFKLVTPIEKAMNIVTIHSDAARIFYEEEGLIIYYSFYTEPWKGVFLKCYVNQ